jgi:hypothetical protein
MEFPPFQVAPRAQTLERCKPGAGEERNFPREQGVGNSESNLRINFQGDNPGKDGETESLKGD